MSSHTRYPPLQSRRAVGQLVAGGLLLALGLCLVGWLIVRVAGVRSLIMWEGPVNVWFAEHRTATFDFLTHVGSTLSDTFACIALLVVMVLVTRVWLGRWREPLALAAAMVGELLVFLVVTTAVQRDRPDVMHLDAAPPTSSFPSGHTAASVALYGCIAVIVNREMRTRWLALLIATVCWSVPVIVGVSRVYRGMHHPTDVVFGYVGGGLWLTIVLVTLLPLAHGPRSPARVPEGGRRTSSLLHPAEPSSTGSRGA